MISVFLRWRTASTGNIRAIMSDGSVFHSKFCQDDVFCFVLFCCYNRILDNKNTPTFFFCQLKDPRHHLITVAARNIVGQSLGTWRWKICGDEFFCWYGSFKGRLFLCHGFIDITWNLCQSMYRHIHLSNESEEWLEGLTNQTFISNFAASSSAACKKVAEDGVAQAHPYRVCVVLNPLCSAQGSRGYHHLFGWEMEKCCW